MAQLSKAVEVRRDLLIKELARFGYKDTKSLTLSELERLHIKVKCHVGRTIKN